MSDPFIRSTVTLIVLSRRPLDDLDVDAVIAECNDGDMVLASVAVDGHEIDRPTMDAALVAAGSDPSFYDDDE